MLTSQLQQTMAILRISLAEIDDKERQLESMISQFRTHLRRLSRQLIDGKTGLDASLSSMEPIEERLSDSTDILRRLRVKSYFRRVSSFRISETSQSGPPLFS